MEAVTFPEANITFAENQPEYIPLPAHRTADGMVTTCWRFGWRERLAVLFGRPLWLQVLTFGLPLEPLYLTMARPFGARPEQGEEGGAHG